MIETKVVGKMLQVTGKIELPDKPTLSTSGKTYSGGHEDTMWTEILYQGRKVRVALTVMLSKDKVAT